MRLDGKLVVQHIETELKEYLSTIKTRPCLAIMLVGDRPDSKLYVSLKKKKCEELGITYITAEFDQETKQQELIDQILLWNKNKTIDGILIQLPLPRHINEQYVLSQVKPKKDVDCLYPETSPYNPCTPLAVMAMIEYYKMPLLDVTLVGCGHVGKGLVKLLKHKVGQLSIVEKKTKQPWQITNHSDLVISCCGQPEMIKADWIKDGAYVIDVGINRIDDKARKSGFRVVGDVAYDEVIQKAHVNKLTVGPITIIMLLKQLVDAHKLKNDALI